MPIAVAGIDTPSDTIEAVAVQPVTLGVSDYGALPFTGGSTIMLLVLACMCVGSGVATLLKVRDGELIEDGTEA